MDGVWHKIQVNAQFVADLEASKKEFLLEMSRDEAHFIYMFVNAVMEHNRCNKSNPVKIPRNAEKAVAELINAINNEVRV